MRMRIGALAAVMSLVAGSASAIDSIYLTWQANNTPTIGTPTVMTSSVVLADVVMDADSAGVSGIGVSFQFDAAELLAVGLKEISPLNAPGMGNGFSPLSPGPSLIDNDNGLIAGFDQADLTGSGLTGDVGPLTLGSVKFHVVQATGDASVIDVTPGFFNSSDGVVDSIGFEKSDPSFTGASVTPEPSAGVLGSIALATLLGLKRRRS
jgi:hypothetical protein